RHARPQRGQQQGEPEPRPGEPAQKRVDVERLHYFIIVTSLKIGRYMATTRPPTTTPRNTIIIGSSSAVSAPTAVSPSSSKKPPIFWSIWPRAPVFAPTLSM